MIKFSNSFAQNRYILFTPFQLHNNSQRISYKNLKTTCLLLLAFVSYTCISIFFFAIKNLKEKVISITKLGKINVSNSNCPTKYIS